MPGRIDARLNELGIEIPAGYPTVGNYVPHILTGSLVFISGQLPVGPKGLEHLGKLGREVSIEDGQKAARLCALNILSRLKVACDGDLDRVTRCVKIGGFVNATEDFDQHAAVMNGCSDFLFEVFGEAGKHARFAVGALSLPLNAAVEVDAIFEIA